MNGRGISSRSNDPMAGFDCSFTTFETPELLSPTTGLDSPIIPLSPPPPPITPSGHSGHGGYRFFFSRSATAPQASIAKKSQNSAPQATSPPKPARVPPHPGIIGLPLAPSQFRKSNAPKALPSEPAHAASPAEESSTSFSTMATPPVQRPAPLRIETTDSPKPNVTQQQHAQTFSMSSSTRTSSRSYVPKSYGMSSPPPSGISTAFSTSSDPRFVDPKTLHYGPHRRAVVVSGDSSAKEMDSLLSYLNSSMPPAPADAGDHHLPQQQPPPPQNNIYTSPTVPLPLDRKSVV